MTEQELRELVRSVIARREVHANVDSASSPSSRAPLSGGPIRQHVSHALFVIPVEGEACIIEPGVSCNHCGYCRSYGH